MRVPAGIAFLPFIGGMAMSALYLGSNASTAATNRLFILSPRYQPLDAG